MLRLALAIIILSAAAPGPIVMRHDVDNAEYLELGRKYGATVSRFSGGCGTLIRPTWAVTAAHVADASYFEDFMDIAGKRYTIKRKVIHPGFALTAGVPNDIALIELTEPVEGITPARLFKDSTEVGKEIVFAGTGWAGSGDVGMVDEHIIKDRQLRGAQNRVDGIRGNYLRFTFDAPDSGNALPLEGISGPGDSGGPALWFSEGQPYILGVSSHQGSVQRGAPQGVYGVEEFYTRISDYQDWILETIGETK